MLPKTRYAPEYSESSKNGFNTDRNIEDSAQSLDKTDKFNSVKIYVGTYVILKITRQ